MLFQGPGRKVILLAIMRHISLPTCGGGVLLFLRSFPVPPPLRFADARQGVSGEGKSRRCLRRNLPFLPGPWKAFVKKFDQLIWR
jgi:hypothetical protein